MTSKKIKHTATYRSKDTEITAIHTHNEKTFIGMSDGHFLIHNQNNTFYSVKVHEPAYDFLQSQKIKESINSFASYDCGNGKLLILSGCEGRIGISEIFCEDEIDFEEKENRATPNSSYGDSFFDSSDDFDLNALIYANEHSKEKELVFREYYAMHEKLFNKENRHEQTSNFNDAMNFNNAVNTFGINFDFYNKSLNSSHQYDIHSLSLSNHFLLSSDYFTIGLSNILKTIQFNEITNMKILNIKPANFSEIDKVITRCKYIDYDQIMFSLSNGNLKSIDTRFKEEIILNIECEYDLLNTIFDFSIIDNLIIIRTANRVLIYDKRNLKKISEIVLFKGTRECIKRLQDNDLIYEKMQIDTHKNSVLTTDIDKNLIMINLKNGKMKKIQTKDFHSKIKVNGDIIWLGGEKLSCYKIG